VSRSELTLFIVFMQSWHSHRLFVPFVYTSVKLRSYEHCLDVLKFLHRSGSNDSGTANLDSSLGLRIRSLILQPLYWYSEIHLLPLWHASAPDAPAALKPEEEVLSVLHEVLVAGKLENLEMFVWEGMSAPQDDQIWETLRLRLENFER
jgi:hypothetical protein